MTDDQLDGEVDMVPLKTLAETLHRLSGGRLLAARDHLPEDTPEAVEARGAARAYQTAIGVCEYIAEHGEVPEQYDDEIWQQYAAVSRQVREADRSKLATETDDHLPDIGVQ